MELVDAHQPVEQVALGYSGGETDGADDNDPFVCKLGGKAAWLDSSSPLPDRSCVVCEQCGSDMLLLVQTYVPLSDSPYDRVLYVWACNRRVCTGKPGTARAIRAHLLNKEYALKLVKRSKAPARQQLKSSGPMAFAAPGSSLFPQKSSGAPKLDFGSLWSPSMPAMSNTRRDGLFTGPMFASKDIATPMCRPEADSSDIAPATGTRVESLSSHLDTLSISPVVSGSDEVLKRVEWPQSAACLPPQYLEFDKERLNKDRIPERYQAEIDHALEAAYGDAGGNVKKGKKSAEAGNEWADE
ncbi:hypothetical protein GGI21_006340, partial [Coemansia aciculifera]